jgi:hypothetical protein
MDVTAKFGGRRASWHDPLVSADPEVEDADGALEAGWCRPSIWHEGRP